MVSVVGAAGDGSPEGIGSAGLATEVVVSGGVAGEVSGDFGVKAFDEVESLVSSSGCEASFGTPFTSPLSMARSDLQSAKEK